MAAELEEEMKELQSELSDCRLRLETLWTNCSSSLVDAGILPAQVRRGGIWWGSSGILPVPRSTTEAR